MVINRDHRTWAAGTVGAALGLSAAYVAYMASAPHRPSGGSWPGLGFGLLGAACMAAAGLLSARKSVRTWRLGSAQAWMRAHIWLGLLAVPCVWFHSAFGLGGALTTALMALFYIVIASGIVGLLLQQMVPAAMTRRVPLETIHAQIDTVRERLVTDAYELTASIAGAIEEATEERARLAAEEALVRQEPAYWKQVARLRPAETPTPQAAELRDFYLAAIRPYLRGDTAALGTPDVRPLLLHAPEEWRTRLERLQGLCDEARQLAVQQRLHRVLHGWLFVHAPLSLLLFVLLAFHIVGALRY